jgi:signal transduction histidine kinase/FixJ family two-component response regulator/HPt (histidine-containing phosphotransfer) domain-containing protein
MSIRVKVFLIIAAIIVVITASCIGFSIFFTQTQILDLIEKDLSLAAGLADDVISNEVNLLITTASSVAQTFSYTQRENLPAALKASVESSENKFIGMSIFTADGGSLLASYGTAPSPPGLETGENLKRVNAGEAFFSTSWLDPDSGALVFQAWVPVTANRNMEKRVLIVTIPGLYFTDLMSYFRIWETGDIFIVDKEGVTIASPVTDRVLERVNPIEMSARLESWKSIGDFIAMMIQGGTGIGRYFLEGVEYVCAYQPVSEGKADWFLGVRAPIAESPATLVQNLLVIAFVLFFGLGLIAAFFASASIAAPFEQIREQNVRLEELRDIAQNASDAKSRFLANMSHEMRTPLNAVIGLSELCLGAGDMPSSIEENLEKVYNSGMTLLGIVNDLLDISKIESGKFELVPAEYDLPSLINDTINLNVIRIGSKPITFKLLIDETLPARLLGDELRVKQIFNNLLSNAFKYTIEGSVVLRIASQEDRDGLWLTISVKDSGIGIKEEERHKLFDDYNRLDLKKTNALEGTGLGLVLTKRMVELMDGAITVESQYGKGSTFTVKIKQIPVDSPPIGPKVAENLMNFRYSVHKRSRNSGLVRLKLPYARVLVVDDVPINLDVAKGMLMPYSMKIDCVLSGADAVEAVRTHAVHYDAIFMDHMMPGMDGIEAVRIIREEIGTEYARDIPIIVLTANAVAGNEEMFLQNGFNDFLSKPIDILRLDTVVHRWVRDKSREVQMEDEPAENTSGTEIPLLTWKIEGMDLEKALRRFGGMENALIGALRSYTVHIHPLLDNLRVLPLPGQVDLLETYTVAVHSIKGASYGICADNVGLLAEELERAARNGDLNYIGEHTEGLIDAAKKTAETLAECFQRGINAKPRRDSPSPGLLARLKEACAAYSVDEVDVVMDELEKYDYASGKDLIAWVREKVNTLDFAAVFQRL